MKNVLVLLLVLGLLLAGWMNRDKISSLWTKSDTTSEEEAPPTLDLPPPAPRGSASVTPHPAREAQAQAMALYPGLTLPNSALNKKFVALYKDSQSTDPAILSRPDWPLELAERAAVSLGGAAMPRSTPAAQARTTKRVVVYTTSHCPYCTKAKQYLTQKGISYQEVDIDKSIAGKDAYKKLGGNGVPLIMVGTTKVEGFDAKELDRLLL